MKTNHRIRSIELNNFTDVIFNPINLFWNAFVIIFIHLKIFSDSSSHQVLY